jgi:hypothetical protein
MKDLIKALIEEIKKYNDWSCAAKQHSFYELSVDGSKFISRDLISRNILAISTFVCCQACGEIRQITFRPIDVGYETEIETLESEVTIQ